MKLSNFSKAQQDFLAVLEAISRPLPIDVAGKLAPLSASELVSLIHHATKANWLKQTDDTHISLTSKIPARLTAALNKLNTPERLNKIMDTLKKMDLYDTLAPVTLLKLLQKSGKKRDAAMVAYGMAIEEIKNHRYKAAYAYQYKAVLGYRDLLEESDINRKFFLAVFSLSDIENNYWYLEDFSQNEGAGNNLSLLDILTHAKEVAIRFKQQRQLALIRLHLARHYINLIRFNDALHEFKKGFALIEQYDDREIEMESMVFYGNYFFLQGKYKKAAAYFENLLSVGFQREGKPHDFKAPLALCTCLSYMGHINRAIGLMDSHIQRARSLAMPDIALSYKIMLGSTLLFTDKRAQAFVQFKESLDALKAMGKVDMMQRVYRNLSYYYFMEGRIHESYTSFKKGFTDAIIHQSIIMFLKAPWVLELIFEYERRGYEPVWGPPLEQYLRDLTKGPNNHFRGVAYRILAKKAEMKGEAPDKINDFLMRSLSNLRRSGDPLETAKTTAFIAQVELRRGETGKARDIALQAWEGLSVLAEEYLPFELKTLIRPVTQDSGKQSFHTLKNYSDLLNEFMPSLNRKEILNRFMIMNCRIFKSERGALFILDSSSKETPELVGEYNISRFEVEDENFRHSMASVQKALASNKIVRRTIEGKKGGANSSVNADILCLPFKIREDLRGVLYLDNRYSASEFMNYGNTLLRDASNNIAIYINRLINFAGEVKRYTSTNIPPPSKADTYKGRQLITKSLVMKDLIHQLDTAAETDASVMILGETGVGKELLAERTHTMGPRGKNSFIDINLASIPETLIESELFGHEKGAFTGANKQKKGYLELANRGTLFIDEIGDAPLSIQVKLLRAIQEKSFYRVGGIGKISSDFRIITATNRDLKGEIEKGNFREDLYYRLNVIQLSVPPLRERGRDILLLADHFLNRLSKRHNLTAMRLSPDDEERLMSYSWPGNVRELENVIERAVILAGSDKSAFQIPLLSSENGSGTTNKDSFKAPNKLPMDEIQRRYIKFILKQTGGRVSGPKGAAEILGMNRSTLFSRMKTLGIK